MEDDFSVSLGIDCAHGSARSLSERERARHIYAVGRTGSGKTTLLRSLALQDIYAGRGVCVIDPHGDNAQALIDSIPRSRINQTIYFDAGDREHVIGFNPLSGINNPHEADLVSSELITLFKGLFGGSWGEWLEYLFKNTLLAVTAQKNEPISLVCVQRMLEDADYRQQVLSRVSDPVVLGFWKKYFSALSKRAALDRISSTLNKVGKFASSPVLRNIIGQTRSGFDIKRVMDEKQILIVNLSKGRIGADNANFLGSAILSKIVSTSLRRSEIPEHERTKFYVQIDEFQNFTTDEFATIVSEARKYALSLTIAHQNFDQIPKNVLNQITKDAGTLLAFKVAFEDNDKLAKAFAPLRAEALSGSSDGSFWMLNSKGETVLVDGYSPADLDGFRTNSASRVVKNSRWRYSRPRAVVEREFNAWYGT
jgi:type IV secretory pathway TraG/TraD family ATPase VirD4